MKVVKIVLLLLLISSLAAQDENNSFENISTFSGLSTSQAKCIFQDFYGYLWIGTIGGGLNRYDGYSFTVYKHSTEDSASLIHDNVYSLTEDNDGNIWAATNDGVSKYVKGEDKFVNYFFRDLFKDLSNISYYSTYEVFVDTKDRLWVGDSYHGALLYNEVNDQFEPVPQQTEEEIDSLPQVYGDITEDTNGKIWASAGVSGLFWYDEENRIFRPAEMDAKNWGLLKTKEIFRVLADSENNIWVMTRTDLYKYETYSQELLHLLNYEVATPINGGYEGELLEDSEGNMLVAHINLSHPLKFPNLSSKPFAIHSSDEMRATDIDEDSFGNIWLTDWSLGVFKQVPTKQNFYQIQKDTENVWARSSISTIYQPAAQPELLFVSASEYGRSALKSYNWNTSQVKNYDISNVSAMISNDDGTFWLGTWGEGLFKWNLNTGELMPYFSDASQNPNLSDASIVFLKPDNTGNIFIGTLNGLYRLSQDGTNLELIIKDHAIPTVYKDDHILWTSAWNAGLIKYNLISKEVEQFRYDKSSNSLSNNIVWDIHGDKEGFLWLATQGGLNRLDLRTNEFKVFTESDGLASNYISAILPDEYGSIWMSTGSGISRLHKDSNNRISFSNYDAMDGLMSPNFRHAYKLKDNSGRLFFGGDRGLYYFIPQKRKSKPPITHLTDLMINGQSIINSSAVDFNQFRNGELSLELAHDQNTLSFQFIALHYAQPIQNRYAYYLKGFESDWQFSKQRDVQYVNLEPGSYQFHLRSANRDGIWTTEEMIIPINIGKPWWKTWYAYLIYFSIVLTGLIGMRRFELNRRKENENKKLLEAENRRKSEELEEARQLQLSMLPRQLPQLPNLDIAVYMKTATEVGGDYYDFHVSLDGTLTVVIGDATGHGMKAGTMVTTAKSLFNSYAPNPDILFSFQEITRCIKNMNLGKLSMCMTMLKIQGDRMLMSSAGMPPSFIFRRDTRIVEEHLMQGMPLGTMNKFPYKIEETKLHPGDTILLMSDGLPELQNRDDELFGYKRVRNIFEEIGEKGPEEIITKFKDDGSAWINDQDPDDDVTFVVIKVKE